MNTLAKHGYILAGFEQKDQNNPVQTLKDLISNADDHIILDLTNNDDQKINILDFKSCLDQQKKSKKSLIFISSLSDIDDLEDEGFSIAPTLVEAEDLLEMENIERDLGF